MRKLNKPRKNGAALHETFRNKKSQMEIVGIALVVVLISLGMLFVVNFVLNRPPSELAKTFKETEISANTLNTLLKTTTRNCARTSVAELYQDCAVHENQEFLQIQCDNGKLSCEYLNETVKEILQKTLAHWNKDFYYRACIWEFSADTGHCRNVGAFDGDLKEAADSLHAYSYDREKEEFDYKGTVNPCKGEKESKSVFIPSDVGTLSIRLDICG